MCISRGWTREDAIYLCWKINHIAPTYGCHVALTGGGLYKPIQEERKDVDILFYSIRQFEEIDVEGLFTALEEILGIMASRLDVNGKMLIKSLAEFIAIRDGVEEN